MKQIFCVFTTQSHSITHFVIAHEWNVLSIHTVQYWQKSPHFTIFNERKRDFVANAMNDMSLSNISNVIFTVSSSCPNSPQMLPIITVWHDPPIEFLSTWVSLLCLYGICSLLLSARAMTACSKNVNDLLICIASSWAYPSANVFPIRSEPARSTRFNFDKV